MSKDVSKDRQPRYRTRWSVVVFVVLALLVALAIIVWQLRGDPPKESDMGLGPGSGVSSAVAAPFAGPIHRRMAT